MKSKKKAAVLIVKILLIILTLIYPLVMVCLAGAGLIYNGESYGRELADTGMFLIISGISMTVGSIFCLFNKKSLNILAMIFSLGGCGLCMIFLKKLCDHADSAGWTDNYTMQPVADMYMVRILPVIIPVIITLGISLLNIRKK